MLGSEEKRKTFYVRRVIFLLTSIVVAIPLLVQMRLPMVVGEPAHNLYDAVEAVPDDKIVIVSANWSAGSKGETAPQTEALIRHLAKSGKRFAIWSWTQPLGPELAQNIAEPIAEEYGLEYGKDWVNWGYRTGSSQLIRGWAKDVWGTIKQDFKGTPVEDIPIMQAIKSFEEMGLIVEITPSLSVPMYIRFLYGVHGVPIGYACTGVMAAEAYPYLDAGQLVGMMRGLAGAAEYEELVGFQGDATRRMVAQSFAHLLIIVLIIVGNVGYLVGLKRRRKRS